MLVEAVGHNRNRQVLLIVVIALAVLLAVLLSITWVASAQPESTPSVAQASSSPLRATIGQTDYDVHHVAHPSGATFTPTSTPACTSGWSSVSSPSAGSNDNHLIKAVALSPTNAWAVGFYVDNSGWNKTLVMHWDGVVWSQVTSPNGGPTNNFLRDLAVNGPDDIWAVGTYWDPSNLQRTLIEHWDGTQWSLVTSPNGGQLENYLDGSAPVGPNDIWAVGEYSTPSMGYSPLSLHWNGAQWSVVPMPTGPSSINYVYAVAPVATNDVWAVGRTITSGISHTLIEHWNGIQWSVVVSPNFGTGSNELRSVSTASGNDVWTVGSYTDGSGADHTLIEHWDGTQWSVVSSPNPGTLANNLYGVSALTGNDIWASGSYRSGTQLQTLIVHWNGLGWSAVSSPNPGLLGSTLKGIASRVADDVWTVGERIESGSVARTLIEHYGGPCATPTPTPTTPPTSTSTDTPTNTPSATPTSTSTNTSTNTPTNTPTSTSTNTPTATMTSCPLQFTDVPVGSTFYVYVRCLACRGIIGGYADGTFRPNNLITRGQLAKIVSNAAGYSDLAGAQLFEDVPPSSAFYDFVQRLATRGYMAGYACGGPGEPCVSPDNRPYFRPNNNATRGQIAKIVSNAVGYSEPAGAQLFDDVAPGSTFYDFVQRLGSRGIMSGYPCGGPGEPCHSGGLPYFRPGNNATRGQTSKIVANTFFPNCQTPVR